MQHTVLITGGAGYVGSTTAWLLLQHGYRVIIVDTKSSSSLPYALRCNTHLQFVHGDYGDAHQMERCLQEYNVDAVIHCAAYIEVSHSVTDPARFYHNNLQGSIALLQAMRAAGISLLLFSSSAAVYGNPHTILLTEEHSTMPLSPYGHTKLMAEQILYDYARAYQMHFIALRYFNVAGALPDYGLGECHVPETHIIPLLFHAAHQRKPFTIFGTQYPTHDGSCVRDYVHVLDIAYAHLASLQHLYNDGPSEVFNIGSGIGVSVKELVAITREVCGLPLVTVAQGPRAGDPAYLVADISKASNILRWQPKHSEITWIVRSAYAFYQAQLQVQHTAATSAHIRLPS